MTKKKEYVSPLDKYLNEEYSEIKRMHMEQSDCHEDEFKCGLSAGFYLGEISGYQQAVKDIRKKISLLNKENGF